MRSNPRHQRATRGRLRGVTLRHASVFEHGERVKRVHARAIVRHRRRRRTSKDVGGFARLERPRRRHHASPRETLRVSRLKHHPHRLHGVVLPERKHRLARNVEIKPLFTRRPIETFREIVLVDARPVGVRAVKITVPLPSRHAHGAVSKTIQRRHLKTRRVRLDVDVLMTHVQQSDAVDARLAAAIHPLVKISQLTQRLSRRQRPSRDDERVRAIIPIQFIVPLDLASRAIPRPQTQRVSRPPREQRETSERHHRHRARPRAPSREPSIGDETHYFFSHRLRLASRVSRASVSRSRAFARRTR